MFFFRFFSCLVSENESFDFWLSEMLYNWCLECRYARWALDNDIVGSQNARGVLVLFRVFYPFWHFYLCTLKSLMLVDRYPILSYSWQLPQGELPLSGSWLSTGSRLWNSGSGEVASQFCSATPVKISGNENDTFCERMHIVHIVRTYNGDHLSNRNSSGGRVYRLLQLSPPRYLRHIVLAQDPPES